MTSIIAWLDTSAEEQRRVREIIALFAQSESRDELGIGQIRDVFSDCLFPGSSVIQTRARYFLFVPWIFRDGATRRLGGPRLKSWTDQRERRLVEALSRAGETEGLIGRRAGPAVKVLPSAIYWSGLRRFGILTRDAAADQLSAAGGKGQEMEELAVRLGNDWSPTLPPAPQGFPGEVEDGFRLSGAEAAWLRERILTAVPDTLLAHLVSDGHAPDPDSPAPWADAACLRAPDPARPWLEHARLFSLAMHGAALLYNLLIGERYEAAGYDRVTEPTAVYRERITDWAKDCAATASQLSRWDRDELWTLVLSVNPRVGMSTRLFVDAWLNAVCTGRTADVADNESLRALVAARERQQKKAQSRLVNDRLLRTWSGASGSATLTFRWPQVRRIIVDIHEGLTAHAGS